LDLKTYDDLHHFTHHNTTTHLKFSDAGIIIGKKHLGVGATYVSFTKIIKEKLLVAAQILGIPTSYKDEETNKAVYKEDQRIGGLKKENYIHWADKKRYDEERKQAVINIKAYVDFNQYIMIYKYNTLSNLF